MISVVIPAFNEENTIGACLEALERQKTDEPFEVVVVDNGSADGTASVVKRFENRLTLRILQEPTKGRGAARKTGWAASRGDIVLSTDADTLVPETWIQAYADFFRTADASIVGATGGYVLYGCPATTRVLQSVATDAGCRLHRLFTGSAWLNGCNFALRKTSYERSGGFRTSVDAYDDWDLKKRVMAQGRIAYLRSNIVKASGRRFERGILRGFLDYVRSFMHMYFLKERKVPLDS